MGFQPSVSRVRAALALAVRCGATIYFAFCEGGIAGGNVGAAAEEISLGLLGEVVARSCRRG